MFVLGLSVFYVDSLSIYDRSFIIDSTLVEIPVCHHTRGHIDTCMPCMHLCTRKTKWKRKQEKRRKIMDSWEKVIFPI